MFMLNDITFMKICNLPCTFCTLYPSYRRHISIKNCSASLSNVLGIARIRSLVFRTGLLRNTIARCDLYAPTAISGYLNTKQNNNYIIFKVSTLHRCKNSYANPFLSTSIGLDIENPNLSIVGEVFGRDKCTASIRSDACNFLYFTSKSPLYT